MTAETSNARGDVVAERQAWYEQQIALAEGQWAEAFLDRWECGDDVPSKEHYVALWLAERAAPQPAAAQQGQAVAEDMGGFTSDTAALAFLHLIGNGNPNVERAVERLRQSLIAQSTQQGGGEVVAHGFYDPVTGAYSESQHTPRWLPAVVCTAPPSAPVGVDAPGSRAWMAEVCRAAALSLAAHGVRNDQLSKVADWIAQHPAAVDEGFVSRLAEALTDQDWDVDPDGDGSGIAQLRAAVAAAQHQEPKS